MAQYLEWCQVSKLYEAQQTRSGQRVQIYIIKTIDRKITLDISSSPDRSNYLDLVYLLIPNIDMY